MKSIGSVLLALALFGMSNSPSWAQEQAQDYPNRQVNFIVPFAPGGGTDILGRLVGQKLSERFGKPFVVENRPGAGTVTAAIQVARSTPDGYTIMVGLWGTHVVNPVIYTLPYDVPTSFEPAGLISTTPHLIAAKQAFPANDLKGLIAWLKANPGKATVGHAGAGSPPHVGAVFFQNATGTSFQLVPYRGAGPAMQDLVAGQIDMLIDSPVTVVPQLKAGKIKAFAIAEKSRLASAPEVPTVDEAGLPGFHMTLWSGLWVPKGTPKEIVAKLNAAAVEALIYPAVIKQLENLGLQMPPKDQLSPQALGDWQKAEIAKWWPMIKAANVKVD